MQLFCQECRTWLKVHVRPGEPETHAGARTRREHQCIGNYLKAFDEIVAMLWDEADVPHAYRGTAGTTQPPGTSSGTIEMTPVEHGSGGRPGQ